MTLTRLIDKNKIFSMHKQNEQTKSKYRVNIYKREYSVPVYIRKSSDSQVSQTQFVL